MAAQILQAAHVTTPVPLNLQYSSDTVSEEYASIKSQLENGGLFKVNLQQTESTQYKKERVITNTSDGAYQAYQLTWYPDYPDPDNFLSPLYRQNSYLSNDYSNSKLDALLQQQTGEQNHSKREEDIKKAQKILAEDLPTIPIVQGSQIAVTGKNVHSVVLDTSFRFRYSSVTK